MASYLAEVLPYWHANLDRPELDPSDRFKAWYEQGPDDLAERFGDLLETLLNEPVGARDIPNTAATIIVLDQFPRRLFPHEARAYSGHALAAELAAPLLAHGSDRVLKPIERIALAMCLCNTESLVEHDRALDWFESTLADTDDENKALLEGFQALARKRREIVRQYGRFPGRNPALGRDSTPAEAYLLVGVGYDVV